MASVPYSLRKPCSDVIEAVIQAYSTHGRVENAKAMYHAAWDAAKPLWRAPGGRCSFPEHIVGAWRLIRRRPRRQVRHAHPMIRPARDPYQKTPLDPRHSMGLLQGKDEPRRWRDRRKTDLNF